MTTQYIYDLTDTWNAGGTVFNAIKMNVTNSASAAGSKLLDLQIGGTTLFNVDKSGNVGIGTSAPSSLLHIRGSSAPEFRLQNDTALSTSRIGFYSSTILDGSVDFVPNSASLTISSGRTAGWGGRILFNTDTTDRMIINSSGNVGIGVTSPAVRLDVSSSSSTPFVLRREAFANGLDVGVQFNLQDSTGTSAAYGGVYAYINSNTSGSQNGGLIFKFANNNSVLTEAMRITNFGLVGIGLTSPSFKFHVQGSGTTALAGVKNTDGFAGGTNFTTPHFILTSGTDVTGNVTRFAMSVGTGSQIFIDALMESSVTVYSSLLFRTRGADGVAERMRIDSFGNVGLGVTPAAWGSTRALQIGTGLSPSVSYVNGFDAAQNAYNDGISWKYILTGYNAGRYTIFGTASGNSSHAWFISGTGTAGAAISFTQAMTLDASGNLGIGTTSPSARLSVSDAAEAKINLLIGSVERAFLSYNEASSLMRIDSDGGTIFATNNTERMRLDGLGNVIVNTGAVATNATNGFLYVPGCAGTPTGTPTAASGRVPIVVDTTNNKLYFYSGGAWRDAGP